MSELMAATGLYLVAARNACRGRDLLDVVEQAIQGGVGCVQLREKNLATRDFVECARALKTLLTRYKVPLIINDRLDIALVCGADGLHLGQQDLSVEDARRWLPPGSWLGLTVNSVADAHAACGLDVDYLGVGPVFPTVTKTDASPPLGLDGFAAVRAASTLPLIAIGGIDRDNARSLFAAGADGLAVVSAICSDSDPKRAAEALLACRL